MYFKPSKLLLKYMSEEPRDIYDIIGALMGYINSDPEFKTHDFDNAVRYVLDNGVSKKDLFSEFDPEIEYEEDPSKWDEEYYSFARVYLKDNFSVKRINHVKAVAHKLYPHDLITEDHRPVVKPKENKKTPDEVPGVKKTQGQQQVNNTTSQNPHNAKIVVYLIVIVVIVLLALIIVYIIK